jgi:hypothetical protein
MHYKADIFKICKIGDSNDQIQTTCFVQSDFYISDLALYSNKHNNQFIFLCNDKKANNSCFYVRLIKAHSDYLQEISVDSISIKFLENLRLNFIQNESLLLILGPKTVIKGKSFGLDWFRK